MGANVSQLQASKHLFSTSRPEQNVAFSLRKAPLLYFNKKTTSPFLKQNDQGVNDEGNFISSFI